MRTFSSESSVFRWSEVFSTDFGRNVKIIPDYSFIKACFGWFDLYLPNFELLRKCGIGSFGLFCVTGLLF